MTTPVTDTPVDRSRDVETFVEEVRGHLADLPVAIVDDLVEGLPGDLADLAAEHPDAPLRTLVLPPDRYAAELRDAAGLTAAAPARPRRPRPIRAIGRWLAGLWRRLPDHWRREIAAFLRAVIPVWWVARGVVLAVVLTGIAGLGGVFVQGLGLTLLVIAAAIASVQLGRSRLRRPRADRWATIAGVLVGIVLLPAILSFLSLGLSGASYAVEPVPADGVVTDGWYTSDLFVYDPDGRLIRDARILDDAGQPVRVGDAVDDELVVPAYPLGPVTGYTDNGDLARGDATPPVVRLPRLDTGS